MGKYKIRSVDIRSPEDQEVLGMLQRSIMNKTDPADTTRGWWWLVERAGEAVGFAGLYHFAARPKAGYLCRSGVLPAHRGHGLQRRLITVRAKKARALKFKVLVTDCRNDNVPSLRNIAAAGFKAYWPKNPWAFSFSTYWRKRI
jgi:ribosomal protein S18 acetylase RimI-like enzyme